MELTLLGTGCPSVDHKRFGPSNLVSTKTAKILVDCGSGITQRLHELKVSSADIDALLFTHLHSDHAVDLYQLIISSWQNHCSLTYEPFLGNNCHVFFCFLQNLLNYIR